MTLPRSSPVLAIVGPTGTGKTELACAVARRTGAEVIGCDSMQVYRGMDVGTAKPAPELREEVPHHGLDLVDPDGEMSAGIFAEIARAAALEIRARGNPAILCGGTGLYARAFAGGLVEGLESDPAIRRELEARDLADLRRELEAVDPASAERITPGDRVRTVRALEAWRIGGRPLSERHLEHRFQARPFEVRWLGLSLARDALWARLEARVDRMFELGLREEVEGLRARGYGRELRSMQAIGYREVNRLIDGEIDDREARDAIYVATRRYARRQRTWFRAEPGMCWTDIGRPDAALDTALRLLEKSS
jgi:tRNA dimethylallyltransferase